MTDTMNRAEHYEELGERLATLMEYAAENPEGQQLWRLKGTLRDPAMREVFNEMIADFRRTAAELHGIAAHLEQAAVTAERWCRTNTDRGSG